MLLAKIRITQEISTSYSIMVSDTLWKQHVSC